MFIKQAFLLLREILHMEDLFNLIEILNQECAVLPPVIKSAATSEEAITSAISLSDLTLASIVLYRKVLLIPSDPSIKKQLEPCFTTFIIASYIERWSLFNKGTF